MGGAYFVWGKGKTATKNLNLNFGANPKNPQLIELVLPSGKSSDDDGGFEHSPRIIGIVMLCRERWRERENATKQEQGDNKYFSFLTFDPPSNILSSFHRKYLANPLSSSHVEAAAVVRESFTKLKQ